MTYIGREGDFWRARHERFGSSLLAVGRVDLTEEENILEYEEARRIFGLMVCEDFPQNRERFRVVDFGYGQGHYAKACCDLGFGTYVGYDLAAPRPRLSLPGNYSFHSGDLTEIAKPERRFELVLCIDTIFHIVDDERFAKAISTLAAHVTRNGYVYITGLFNNRRPADHVRHRQLEAFAPLVLVGELRKWRDTKIGRFKVRR